MQQKSTITLKVNCELAGLETEMTVPLDSMGKADRKSLILQWLKLAEQAVERKSTEERASRAA